MTALGIYIALCIIVPIWLGTSMKRYRADCNGMTLDQDTMLEDEAQMYYLKHGKPMPVEVYKSRAERIMGL